MLALILGPLLFAGGILEARALQPALGDLDEGGPAAAREQWPWDRKAAADPEMRGKFLTDPKVHEGLPPSPGCWMRMASCCPKHPMSTFAWRPDTLLLADQRGTDEARCRGRKAAWDSFCGTDDAEMLYVGGEAVPVQRHAAVDSASDVPSVPSAQSGQRLATASDQDSDVLTGYPTEPGCYLRTPTGCPANPMKTRMWRHDKWAEQHELTQAGCKGRKHTWDKYCGTDDVKVLFVPRH
mmetsp:Transcript_1878/g.5032  ORF Transcript_1878/g.5032 Transcript_1878/m.5032 type:complete len:239 (+) Transcript_1878:101-817(+)